VCKHFLFIYFTVAAKEQYYFRHVLLLIVEFLFLILKMSFRLVSFIDRISQTLSGVF